MTTLKQLKKFPVQHFFLLIGSVYEDCSVLRNGFYTERHTFSLFLSQQEKKMGILHIFIGIGKKMV
jgi:hypothetical protein